MAKFKNDQPFFSYYDLSNHTTYGHTEGGVRESFAAWHVKLHKMSEMCPPPPLGVNDYISESIFLIFLFEHAAAYIVKGQSVLKIVWSGTYSNFQRACLKTAVAESLKIYINSPWREGNHREEFSK